MTDDQIQRAAALIRKRDSLRRTIEWLSGENVPRTVRATAHEPTIGDHGWETRPPGVLSYYTAYLTPELVLEGTRQELACVEAELAEVTSEDPDHARP